MRILLVNGPPHSGKDEAARTIRTVWGVQHMEFKRPLIEAALALSGFTESRWNEIYDNRDPTLGDTKETPLEALGGLSQRQFLIKISEEWVKPVFGQAHFGNVAKERILSSKASLFVFSDSGFTQEAEPLIHTFGRENVGLLRVWRSGCRYTGDSRYWLPLDMFCWGVDLINNDTLDNFKKDVIMVAKAFFGDSVQ